MPSQPWYADGLTFTCTQCGQCCTGPTGYVWHTPEEAQAMADQLGIPLSEFRRKYTRRVYGRVTLTENRTEHGYDCVFLDRDSHGRALCKVYASRPQQCRTWPFWHENLRSPQSYEAASQRCPGMTAGLQGHGKFYPIQQIRIIRDGGKATG